MNIKFNFYITCKMLSTDSGSTTSVKMVETIAGENITEKFLTFCQKHNLPLTSDKEIRAASVKYGHSE